MNIVQKDLIGFKYHTSTFLTKKKKLNHLQVCVRKVKWSDCVGEVEFKMPFDVCQLEIILIPLHDTAKQQIPCFCVISANVLSGIVWRKP